MDIVPGAGRPALIWESYVCALRWFSCQVLGCLTSFSALMSSAGRPDTCQRKEIRFLPVLDNLLSPASDSAARPVNIFKSAHESCLDSTVVATRRCRVCVEKCAAGSGDLVLTSNWITVLT